MSKIRQTSRIIWYVTQMTYNNRRDKRYSGLRYRLMQGAAQ